VKLARYLLISPILKLMLAFRQSLWEDYNSQKAKEIPASLLEEIPVSCVRHNQALESVYVAHHERFAVTYWKITILLAAKLLIAQDSAQKAAEYATLQIQNGEFQSAAQLLQQELRQNPKNIELWNLLGIAETELKQPQPAKSAFERGLALAPDSVSLNENIGLLFFRQADYESAKKYLRRAVELSSQKPGVLFSLAAARLRTREQAQALADLTSLEPVLANVSEYWEERGRAELLNNPARAEASFNRAVELKPDSVNALNDAASAAERQNLDEKALAYLMRARAADPNDVATLAHFGEVCIRRDLGPDAHDALAKAHQFDPSNNSVLYLLARANVALQNWQTAYDLFNEFSTRVPTFAPAYYAMGWLDVRLNHVDDARRQLERALLLAPSLTGARYELAQLDLNDGELDSAKKLLESVLKQDPEDAKANMTLGDLMTRTGKLDEAQTFLESAIRSDPTLAAAHYKLSILYFRKHETAQAEREKTIATNLNAEANRASKTQLRLVLPETAEANGSRSRPRLPGSVSY
jgi:tetratricopeptide (TPR) repeat protein